jgi:hypothetical protein
MDEKIKKVIDEIGDLCEKANIDSSLPNLIHILIAYIRTPEIKTEEDYAINAIVAAMIYGILPRVDHKKLKISADELRILCNAIMVNKIVTVELPDEEKIEFNEDGLNILCDNISKSSNEKVTEKI